LSYLRLRRWRRRRRERGEKRSEFRARLEEIRQAVERFEQVQEFDEQIRLLADITRHGSKAYRALPDQPQIMHIVRMCEDERRKLAQHWAVAEATRLMAMMQAATNLRVRAGRADQVVEALKIVSRLLFPHDKITHAMHSVTHYQEALEGALALPPEEQAQAVEGSERLLAPYFQIIDELRKDNQELARSAWPAEQVRATLTRLQRM
ncbi:MAG: hypothetical protein ACE5HB_08690, partial [Terriglobia bacterium]